MQPLMHRWSTQELVVIGVFAAATKVATMLVALAGGGMTPVAMIGKNMVYTTLVIVMLCKVRRPGTLLLFTVISIIVNMLLLGASVTLLPPMFVAAVLAELAMWPGRNSTRTWVPVLGAAVFDIVSKVLALGASWLNMRENPSMVIIAAVIVGIGYIGSLAGLWSGVKTVKELRHAGIIRQ